MQISHRQIAQLSRVSEQRFEQKCCAHFSPALRALDAGMTPAQVEEFVRQAIKSAQRVRFTQERDIVEYIEVLTFIGPGRWRTNEFAWVNEVFDDALRPPRDRLRDVVERLRFAAGGSSGP